MLLRDTFVRFGSVADVAQWACHAICNLVVDTELAVTLGTSPDCAIIEGLIQVLNTHAADADVLEEALMACSALAAV